VPRLQLYKVGAHGRIQLDGIATEGDHYTAEKEDDGTIVLSPVEVNTTTTKRAAVTTDDPGDYSLRS
jgi:hypothetical protein